MRATPGLHAGHAPCFAPRRHGFPRSSRCPLGRRVRRCGRDGRRRMQPRGGPAQGDRVAGLHGQQRLQRAVDLRLPYLPRSVHHEPGLPERGAVRRGREAALRLSAPRRARLPHERRLRDRADLRRRRPVSRRVQDRSRLPRRAGVRGVDVRRSARAQERHARSGTAPRQRHRRAARLRRALRLHLAVPRAPRVSPGRVRSPVPRRSRLRRGQGLRRSHLPECRRRIGVRRGHHRVWLRRRPAVCRPAPRSSQLRWVREDLCHGRGL